MYVYGGVIMIDIHTHILPNVDDGSKSLEESIELLKSEVENGVNKVILTPHQNARIKTKDELINKFIEFKKEINFIDIYLGSEIYYYENIIDDLINNNVLTINNTKYVLIEFSTKTETNIADIIYEIVLRGFKPIVAHIERYPYLKLEDYLAIKQNGGLIQINASAIDDKYYKKRVKILLKNRLIDFVASDCHNIKSRNVDFNKIKKLIENKYNDQFDHIFNDDFIFN